MIRHDLASRDAPQKPARELDNCVAIGIVHTTTLGAGSPCHEDETMKEKVEGTIAKIRPFLQRDGGDIELLNFDDEKNVVTVRLQGACHGCPGAAMTLKLGVERTLREEVDPNITVVTA